MRFVLALCIVAGCALCGRSMAGSARRRYEMLQELVRGIRLLRIHMISMFEPLQQSLSRTGAQLFEMVGDAMKPGVSAGEAWREIRRRETRRGGRIDALNREDLRAFDQLFSHLGESGRDVQDVLLDGAATILGKNLESAEKKAREADRLYVSLGFMTGLAIALAVV